MTELRSPEHTRNGNRNDTQDTQKQARNEVQKVSVILEGEPVTFHFFPGEDFDRVERLSFLNILFRRPVRNVRISSAFGWRKSPVTGLRSFHGGVDFPASTGTEVVASRDGKVVDVGTDSWYGKYVIIDHSGGYRTFYAHLDATVVELNEVVSSGKIIGRVGSTGMSTGPHLHFEIRMDGIPRDPVRHLPGLKR
jgi:murein DD-endopeptidase MepM/ murein hydrolase activator NlpD